MFCIPLLSSFPEDGRPNSSGILAAILSSYELTDLYQEEVESSRTVEGKGQTISRYRCI